MKEEQNFKRIYGFLTNLKHNNSKEWFHAHKTEFIEAQAIFVDFLAKILEKIAVFDPDIKGLTPKNCIYRIYKDVRFSKDKSPYKLNFGANIVPGGKKTQTAGYYIHIEPSGSFIGGGIYQPEPKVLYQLRENIQKNPQKLLKILHQTEFKKIFKDFEPLNRLKTAPKGFDKNDPNIEILKNKHFVVIQKLPDALMEDTTELLKETEKSFKILYPLLAYFRD